MQYISDATPQPQVTVTTQLSYHDYLWLLHVNHPPLPPFVYDPIIIHPPASGD
ncbi:hypothetical protein BC827DRAFT_1244181, partial [Russula dissimulans]